MKTKLKIILIMMAAGSMLFAGDDGFKIAIKNTGLCLGNSKNFTGIRMNVIDKDIEKIRGINVTLWSGNDKENGVVTGLSMGLLPAANTLNGLNFGVLGIGSNENMNGISLGLLGLGAGNNINGIALGGLGAGSGHNLNGFGLGLAGLGVGNDVNGIAIGGLGLGVGNNFKGFGFGGFGLGAGNNFTGISLSFFGAGYGNDFIGISLTGLGMGAGNNLSGLMFSGLGMGAGNNIRGIALAGLGLGAGHSISGLVFGGAGVGAPNLSGIILSLGKVQTMDEGKMKGLAIATYNDFPGSQTGVSIGIVNKTNELFGFQFGLINIVNENPKLFRVLPLMNFNLKR